MSVDVTIFGASPAALAILRRSARSASAVVSIIEGLGEPGGKMRTDWVLVTNQAARLAAVRAGLDPYRVGVLREPLHEEEVSTALRRMAVIGPRREVASAFGVGLAGVLFRWYASRALASGDDETLGLSTKESMAVARYALRVGDSQNWQAAKRAAKVAAAVEVRAAQRAAKMTAKVTAKVTAAVEARAARDNALAEKARGKSEKHASPLKTRRRSREKWSPTSRFCRLARHWGPPA
jgi:hypothetical protein